MSGYVPQTPWWFKIEWLRGFKFWLYDLRREIRWRLGGEWK